MSWLFWPLCILYAHFTLGNHNCTKPAPPKCFNLVHGGRHIYLSSSCNISKWYPFLLIFQGSKGVRLLGTQEPLVGVKFDLDRVPLSGDVKLKVGLYLHCVVNLYSQSPWIHSSKDELPVINSPLFSDLQHKLPSAAVPRLPAVLQPMAFDRKSCQVLGTTVQPPLHDLKSLLSGGAEWIHFMGDSNTRNLRGEFCRWCKGSYGPVCECAGGRLLVYNDIAWPEHIDNAGVIGTNMTRWGPNYPNKPALFTIFSLGSHTIFQSQEWHEWAVPKHFDLLLSRRPPRNLVHALVMPTCIGKIPEKHYRTHGSWEHLVRNNYRVQWLNQFSTFLASKAGIRIADFFSPILSAGCQLATDAAHFEKCVYFSLANSLADGLQLQSLVD